MVYETYITHIDARVREALARPAGVTLRRMSDGTASWSRGERIVLAELIAERQVEFLLHRAADEFPYDRFSDDPAEPDIATSARKVADFFNEADLTEPN
jgi:hypothetical protein